MAKPIVRVTLTPYKTKPAAPKPVAAKPVAPKAPKPIDNRAAMAATVARANRMQGEEARSERLLMKNRSPAKDIISVTTRMRETPTKKGK